MRSTKIPNGVGAPPTNGIRRSFVLLAAGAIAAIAVDRWIWHRPAAGAADGGGKSSPAGRTIRVGDREAGATRSARDARIAPSSESGGAGADRIRGILDDPAGLCGHRGPGAAAARNVSDADVRKGLRVTSLYLAKAATVHDGLVSASGAGWQSYRLAKPALPFETTWTLVCSLWLPDASAATIFTLSAVVTDPQGRVVTRAPLSASRDAPNAAVTLPVTITRVGLWSIGVVSGDVRLDRIEVEVKLR